MFKIEQQNKLNDEEIIQDYIRKNYKDKVDDWGITIDDIDEVVIINGEYVEV